MWKLKHANSILETFQYFCQISSKLILIIFSYTVSKLVHFFETQCTWCRWDVRNWRQSLHGSSSVKRLRAPGTRSVPWRMPPSRVRHVRPCDRPRSTGDAVTRSRSTGPSWSSAGKTPSTARLFRRQTTRQQHRATPCPTPTFTSNSDTSFLHIMRQFGDMSLRRRLLISIWWNFVW